MNRIKPFLNELKNTFLNFTFRQLTSYLISSYQPRRSCHPIPALFVRRARCVVVVNRT